MSWEEIVNVVQILLKYVVPSLKVFGFTLLFSVPLGMIVAMLKMCRFKPVSWITNIYILIMRGTPLMLQIIAVCYALPKLRQMEGLPEFMQSLLDIFDVRSENYLFNTIIVAFTMNYAAYFAEIFRGGIESIPKGQYEAAASLSMTKGQTFFHVILPQVVKRVVPASSNEIIILVKDTSLAGVISYIEITAKARQMMNTYSSLTPMFIAGGFYLIFSMVITLAASYVEKRLNYYK